MTLRKEGDVIIEKESLLPIVIFDENHGWADVQELCSKYLDVQGQQRLQDALGNMVVSVAVEYHYIDKDYRDTFSNFHSKRFNTPDSRCVRLHFFSKEITTGDIASPDCLQPAYLGYSVIRPTRPNCIGRTLIDIKNFQGMGAFICTCRETVNLQGCELSLEGFPFISQDSDATVCAQSALWMIVRYYTNRYSLYRETYPFQLTQLTKDYSIGRIYPSSGLTMWQLGESLRQLGFSPLIYDRETFKGDFDRLLYTYIESGIPVLAGVPSHVVAIFGHISQITGAKRKNPTFSSEYCTSWIVSDDNQSPCVELNKNGGGTSKFKFSEIDSFIAPLAEKIFLTAENFEKVVRVLLNDPKVGISCLSPKLAKAQMVLRMYLTTVKSFKKKISYRGMGHPDVDRLYRQLPLPHFIWVCELSTPSDYAAGNILGEIIWDATRNVWETEGWIAIHYPENLLVDVGSALNDIQRMFNFNLTQASKAYPMYRSNLKEV